MHLGTTYDEGFKTKHGYDHVIECQGYWFQTDFMKQSAGMRECTSERGQIYVNDHF